MALKLNENLLPTEKAPHKFKTYRVLVKSRVRGLRQPFAIYLNTKGEEREDRRGGQNTLNSAVCSAAEAHMNNTTGSTVTACIEHKRLKEKTNSYTKKNNTLNPNKSVV